MSKEITYKDFGGYGYAENKSTGAVTYEILATDDAVSMEEEKEKYSTLNNVGDYFSFNNYTIASRGDDNNLPGELSKYIKYNHLLPEIMKKQVRMMWGQGAFLYRAEFQGDDVDSKRLRIPVDAQNGHILHWLDSWKQNGLPSFAQYAKQSMFSYYYTEDVWNKWRFTNARRIGGKMPVLGLERVNPVKARLALEGNLQRSTKLTDNMLTHVILNEWDKPFYNESEVYNRFDPSNPFKHGVAINNVGDFGFDDDIYPTPTYFYGLRPWIKCSNLNPEYINSYLKHSLNAKLHIIIPDSWIKSKETTLQNICSRNSEYNQSGETEKIVDKYDGLTGIGTVFSHSMVSDLIKIKLAEITNVMSGSGKNQGKTFWSRSFKTQYGVEKWEFEEIPVKYKEFVQSIIEVDKRAVEVILQGKGISPSISNVSNQGIFTNSGSELYYNILVYLNTLFYAEDFICEDINLAIKLNFPKAYEDGVRLGFYRNVPDRQEEVKPENRLEKSTPK